MTACTHTACEQDRAGQQDASQPPPSAEAIEASLSAAEEYFHTRDLAKAEAILLRLLDRAPKQPHALELYGQLLMAKAADAREAGNAEQASALVVEAYQQYRVLADVQRESAGIQQSAGEIAHMAGRLDDAMMHYTRVQSIDEENVRARLYAAQIHIERSEYQQAQAMLERVLELDADEPSAYASLANIAIVQERYVEALDYLAEAREIRPGDVTLRAMQARVYRKQGDAEASLQMLLALGPQQRTRWIVADELAAAHGELANHHKAAEVWEHVYSSGTAGDRAWLAAVRASEALLLADQRDRAWGWMQEAQLLAPDEPQTKELAASFAREQ